MVDSDRPPQGALQTSGAGTKHATAVDSGAFSRKVMIKDQYGPWLFGAANPPDSTAGEQLSVVDPIAMDFVVGTDGALSIEFGMSPGAEDSLRSNPEWAVRAVAMGELNRSMLLPCLGFFLVTVAVCTRGRLAHSSMSMPQVPSFMIKQSASYSPMLANSSRNNLLSPLENLD